MLGKHTEYEKEMPFRRKTIFSCKICWGENMNKNVVHLNQSQWVAGWDPTMRGPTATGGRLDTTISTVQINFESHIFSLTTNFTYWRVQNTNVPGPPCCTWVGVICSQSYGGSPFVMCLVDVLVQPSGEGICLSNALLVKVVNRVLKSTKSGQK